jgi:hypothetical protein
MISLGATSSSGVTGSQRSEADLNRRSSSVSWGRITFRLSSGSISKISISAFVLEAKNKQTELIFNTNKDNHVNLSTSASPPAPSPRFLFPLLFWTRRSSFFFIYFHLQPLQNYKGKRKDIFIHYYIQQRPGIFLLTTSFSPGASSLRILLPVLLWKHRYRI